MKKIIYTLLVAATMASCQKEDHNGDLGGYWKLMQVELSTDSTVINNRNKSLFWAVQLDLIQIANSNGRFQHINDSLFVQMITMPEYPERYGLFNPSDERFRVLHLDRNGMILRSKDATLTFKKF